MSGVTWLVIWGAALFITHSTVLADISDPEFNDIFLYSNTELMDFDEQSNSINDQVFEDDRGDESKGFDFIFERIGTDDRDIKDSPPLSGHKHSMIQTSVKIGSPNRISMYVPRFSNSYINDESEIPEIAELRTQELSQMPRNLLTNSSENFLNTYSNNINVEYNTNPLMDVTTSEEWNDDAYNFRKFYPHLEEERAHVQPFDVGNNDFQVNGINYVNFPVDQDIKPLEYVPNQKQYLINRFPEVDSSDTDNPTIESSILPLNNIHILPIPIQIFSRILDLIIPFKPELLNYINSQVEILPFWDNTYKPIAESIGPISYKKQQDDVMRYSTTPITNLPVQQFADMNYQSNKDTYDQYNVLSDINYDSKYLQTSPNMLINTIYNDEQSLDDIKEMDIENRENSFMSRENIFNDIFSSNYNPESIFKFDKLTYENAISSRNLDEFPWKLNEYMNEIHDRIISPNYSQIYKPYWYKFSDPKMLRSNLNIASDVSDQRPQVPLYLLNPNANFKSNLFPGQLVNNWIKKTSPNLDFFTPGESHKLSLINPNFKNEQSAQILNTKTQLDESINLFNFPSSNVINGLSTPNSHLQIETDYSPIINKAPEFSKLPQENFPLESENVISNNLYGDDSISNRILKNPSSHNGEIEVNIPINTNNNIRNPSISQSPDSVYNTAINRNSLPMFNDYQGNPKTNYFEAHQQGENDLRKIFPINYEDARLDQFNNNYDINPLSEVPNIYSRFQHHFHNTLAGNINQENYINDHEPFLTAPDVIPTGGKYTYQNYPNTLPSIDKMTRDSILSLYPVDRNNLNNDGYEFPLMQNSVQPSESFYSSPQVSDNPLEISSININTRNPFPSYNFDSEPFILRGNSKEEFVNNNIAMNSIYLAETSKNPKTFYSNNHDQPIFSQANYLFDNKSPIQVTSKYPNQLQLLKNKIIPISLEPSSVDTPSSPPGVILKSENNVFNSMNTNYLSDDSKVPTNQYFENLHFNHNYLGKKSTQHNWNIVPTPEISKYDTEKKNLPELKKDSQMKMLKYRAPIEMNRDLDLHQQNVDRNQFPVILGPLSMDDLPSNELRENVMPQPSVIPIPPPPIYSNLNSDNLEKRPRYESNILNFDHLKDIQENSIVNAPNYRPPMQLNRNLDLNHQIVNRNNFPTIPDPFSIGDLPLNDASGSIMSYSSTIPHSPLYTDLKSDNLEKKLSYDTNILEFDHIPDMRKDSLIQMMKYEQPIQINRNIDFNQQIHNRNNFPETPYPISMAAAPSNVAREIIMSPSATPLPLEYTNSLKHINVPLNSGKIAPNPPISSIVVPITPNEAINVTALAY